MAKVKKPAGLTVRFAVTKDIPALLELDFYDGESIWDNNTMNWIINHDQGTSVLVAVQDKKIVGMLVYELYKKRFSVVYLAIVNQQYSTIGKKLIAEMVHDFNIMTQNRVVWYVREAELDLQVFLRDEFGFRCTRVVKGWFRDFNPGEGVHIEDAYRFRKTKERHEPDIQRV